MGRPIGAVRTVAMGACAHKIVLAFVLLNTMEGWFTLPVLNHDHSHPVGGIHVLAVDQVLKQQEALHQEVLKGERRAH